MFMTVKSTGSQYRLHDISMSLLIISPNNEEGLKSFMRFDDALFHINDTRLNSNLLRSCLPILKAGAALSVISYLPCLLKFISLTILQPFI